VDPRAGLNDVEMRKFLPHRNSNSDLSAVQPVASRYTDCPLPALKEKLVAYFQVLEVLIKWG
jgi:hypothetical protein